MTHDEGSAPHAEAPPSGPFAGGVALQSEVARAVDILSGDPRVGSEAPFSSGSEVSTGSAESAIPPAIPSPVSGPVPAPGPAANSRPAGIVVGIVALVFAAGAVAVLSDQIGGLDARAKALEARLDKQDQALADLARSGDRARAERAALQARLAAEIASEHEAAARAIEDLRAGEGEIQKSGLELSRRVDEATVSGAAREQEMNRRHEELSASLAKSRDDGRALEERLAKLEESSQRSPAGAPTSAAPAEAGGSRLGPLIADLQSPKAATRWEAVDQIGQSKDPEAVPYLLPLLKDVDVFVRMATARVLGDLKVTSAVPALIDALEDAEAAVREAALGALRTLTGKDLRFDPMASEAERAKRVKAWREWWKKSEEEAGQQKTQG